MACPVTPVESEKILDKKELDKAFGNVLSSLNLLTKSTREALSRALFNLLDNAAKYSGASRNICFRAWAERENVFLEVRDEGIGISKEDQKKVFEKFYRAHSVHDSNIKGSGLGLTVVDHIVKAHGGEILIESEVAKGTKVTIKIPAKREAS